jgi:hypothetical protein
VSKKETYKLVNGNGVHEYDITVKKKANGNIKFKLKTSNNGDWSNPNETILTMTETEYGVKCKELDEFMDYEYVEYIGLLTRFMSIYDTTPEVRKQCMYRVVRELNTDFNLQFEQRYEGRNV